MSRRHNGLLGYLKFPTTYVDSLSATLSRFTDKPIPAPKRHKQKKRPTP
jgi:hypothetical protein